MNKKQFHCFIKILFIMSFAIVLWQGNLAFAQAETQETETPSMSLSTSSVELSMENAKTYDVTIKLSGDFPDTKFVTCVTDNTDLVSTSWKDAEWRDTDGDGNGDTRTLTYTAMKGGSTFSQFYFYESTSSWKLYKMVQIGVTVGPEYTVTYDANGGTGTFASQTKTYGNSVTLNNAVPTRTGYTFLGWSTDKTATTAEYKAGDTYTADADATLYAVWKQITYTIKFDANGGTGAPTAQTKIYGEKLTLSTVTPTREGYTFIGWGDSDNPTAARYGAGSHYTYNRNDVLTAVWLINTYTITYDVGEGWAVLESETKDHGTDLVLNKTAPTRTGYTFLGWATSEGSTNIAYKLGDTYSQNEDITLYAIWKPDEYTITYHLNGGSGTMSSQTKVHDIALTLTTTTPTREGYTFLGWSEYKDATYASYEAGAKFEVNDTVTLYAIWDPVEYTITFNANKGESVPDSIEKSHDIPLDYLGEAYRTGYIFLGWAENSEATTAQYSATGNYTKNGDVTLYAVWKAKKCTVTYNANGGSGAPAAFIDAYDTKVTLSKLTPSRTGYTFLGWSVTKVSNEPEYASGDSYTVKEDATLYAVWKPNEFTVSYHANGGDYAPSSQVKYYGINITLRAEYPTREGYKFLGWNDNGVLYASGETYYLNKSTTMYAVWEKESTGVSGTTGTNGTTGVSGTTGTTESTGTSNNTGTQTQKPQTTITGPQEQVIDATSKNFEYKKGKTIKLNATTNGNGVLTYKSSNKKVVTISKVGKITIKGYGKATITITASATSTYNKAVKKITIKVVPKKMSLKKISSTKKKYASATWKKDSTVTGYQMYICLRKDFKKGAYERTYKKSLSKMTLKGLKSKKIYYFKIRAYKTVKGKKYYGAWSTVKKVKIK